MGGGTAAGAGWVAEDGVPEGSREGGDGEAPAVVVAAMGA